MKIFTTKIKFFLLLLFMLANVSIALAQVIITQPTGGQNISADKAVGGSSAGYTTIGDIIIADQAAGNFAVGTDRKIYLVPSQAHWQIEPGIGSVNFGGTNITAASILVESGRVTVTYTVSGATADDNFISISGIRVQSNTTARETTAATLRRSTTVGTNSGTISGFANNGVVATLSEVAGNFTQLQVLLPGETSAPGTVSGKTGTPTNRSSGVSTTVTVNAVDAYWNRVTTVSDQIAITTSDANGTVPANNTLAAGTRNFNVVLRTIGSATVTATDNTGGGITPVVSSSVNVVLGAFTRLQLLLPGETAAPGTATGKTGAPIAQTAGTPFIARVRSVDAGWNLVTGNTDVIRLTTTDLNATMPANLAMEVDGEVEFSTVSLVTGGNRTITATNMTDGTKTANTSPNVAIAAGTVNKLQILLPGETAAPGTVTGKTGTPTDRNAGVAFSVTVNAVDAYWNRVTSVTDVVAITTDNVNAVTPVNAPLVAGTKNNFSVTLMTAGVATVTATDVTNGGITANISSNVNVIGGVFTKLQILLPGETAAPATPTGKTGTPTPPVAGTPFIVRVRAVDGAWNLVTGITDVVRLTTTDANATMPADLAMEADGEVEFSAVTLVTAGSRTITAANITDGTKLSNTSPAVVVAAGAYTKLQILLPGETAAAGTLTGKTGTPTDRSVGASFNVTVNAVDANWNRITGITDVIAITTDDASATNPANAALVNGTKNNFAVILRTPGTATITATNTSNGGITQALSSNVNVIGGIFTKLQILLPGETADPGTPTGKTGTPTPPVAGTPFIVRVRAVDGAWNLVTGITDLVRLTTTDANATMPADLAMEADGEVEFSAVTLVTAGSRTITAANITDGTKLSNTSPAVVVAAGAYTKLQILLPGETAAAGTLTGKTGTPTDRTSGVAFTTLTVNAVDAYWNRVLGITDVIAITSSDANATLPVNAALANGTKANFSVTLRTLGTATITATNTTNGGITQAISSSVNVVGGTYTKLQILLPGETAAPGTATGKTGTPTAQVAGVPFSVTVNAVDAGWNLVNTVTNNVSFTAANDIYAEVPATGALVNGTLSTTATYRIGGGTNRTLRANDASDGTKTANTSPAFTVNVGPFTRLLVLLPGETLVAGHPNGKTGTPGNQGTGVAFAITVRATDAAFNAVTTGITDVVGITSSEGTATLPANAAMTNGLRTFNITLNEVSNSNTITATDITNGTRTPYTTAGILVVSPTATTDYFRSVLATGNWNVSSSWESSANGVSGWQPATIVPTNLSTLITIRSGNTINVTANTTVDNVVIENGGQVNLTGGTLTIANGAASVDFRVDGILRNTGRPITTAGVLQVTNGGRYQHNFTTTSGTLPTATWATGSICEIVGYTTFAADVLGSNQVFSDFVWNATGQTGAGSPSLLGSFTARNFTVTSTGSGRLNLAATGGSATILGNYTQAAGTVLVNKTSGTQNLALAGDFSVNGGSFGLGNGTVNLTFNGTAQSLSNAGAQIQFGNVTFSNGGTKTLTSGNFALATTGALTMGASTTLNANGNLTVLSNASGSGSIEAIPSSAAITGNVNVQRFITGGSQSPYRTYRMFSSPIYTNGNPGNRTYPFSEFIDDMIVTGAGGATNGFDETGINPAGAWSYAGSGFTAITNINATLPVGKGAYVFFRGNRSNPSAKITAPFDDPENTVMDFTGVLNQQNVAVSLVNGGNLVGNPYASSIDWNSPGISKSGLTNNTIRIWNPESRSYTTYDGVIAVPSGVASNIIPSGQGFFVQSTGGGTLTFSEDAKISDQASPLLMSTPTHNEFALNSAVVSSINNSSTLAIPHTELRLTLSPNGSSFKEETAIVFQAGKSGVYNATEDANYIHNYSAQEGGQKVFLSSLSTDNRNLVINYMPEIAPGSKVKLNINDFNLAGDYKLLVSYKDVPAGYIVKLNDSFLGTSTAVQDGYIQSFSIDKNVANTFGTDRFSVAFEAPTTLPVTYNSFSVAKINEGVLVKWSTLTETNNNRFEVERAGDDKSYVKLHTEIAKGSGGAYAYIDKNPLLGNNYYRLVQVDNDSKPTASNPQVINYTGELTGGKDAVNVFPNPVVSKFTVKYNGALKNNQQTVKIVNATGQVLLTKAIAKAELTTGYDFNIASLATGVYMIEIYDGGNQRVGQTKLIKQ